MLCDEVLEILEPVAAGDRVPEPRLAAHLASCDDCRTALRQAREVERLLHERQAPAAPPQFTSRALARIRREHWRRDQLLDAGFNTAVIALGSAVVIAVLLIVNQSGMLTFSNETFPLIQSAVATLARRVAPAVPLYAAAAALVGATVGIWWWAERDLTP
jgi:predicted anti-sigma-YlaC factor YlaD